MLSDTWRCADANRHSSASEWFRSRGLPSLDIMGARPQNIPVVYSLPTIHVGALVTRRCPDLSPSASRCHINSTESVLFLPASRMSKCEHSVFINTFIGQSR